MDSERNTPAPAEIKIQLERMLATESFKKLPKLTKLLNRLVTGYLNGTPTDEDILGVEIFERKNDWIPLNDSVVRAGMRNLRDALDEYYKGEGSEDLILIEFLRGQGYKPNFSYNARSAAAQRYRRSMEFFNETFPDIRLETTFNVVTDFQICIGTYESYAPAYASFAEILLIYTMCEAPNFIARERLPEIERLANECLRLNDQNWLAYVISGAVHCCRYEWGKAADAFNVALGIAPEQTCGHLWYLIFLWAVGRKDEAWQCIARYRQSEDKRESMIYSLFLYVKRVFDFAYPHLLQAEGYFQAGKGWILDSLMACVFLEQGNNNSAEARTSDACRSSTLSNGIWVVAAAKVGRAAPETSFLQEAWQAFATMRERPYRGSARWYGPVAMALAYMGLGWPGPAISWLKEACEEGHPLMVWLHIWPIFDPLRNHEGFKALISRMNLPA